MDFAGLSFVLDAAPTDTGHAMSPDNVEIVRRSLARWNQGAAAIADVVGESWEPNADYYPVRKFPESQPRHGQDEITEWFTAFIDAWEFVEFVVKRIVAVGDDRVLAQATMLSLIHISEPTRH